MHQHVLFKPSAFLVTKVKARTFFPLLSRLVCNNIMEKKSIKKRFQFVRRCSGISSNLWNPPAKNRFQISMLSLCVAWRTASSSAECIFLAASPCYAPWSPIFFFFPLKNSECQVTDTIVHYQLTNTYLQQMKSQKYLHNLFLNEFFDVAHKLLTLHQMTEMNLRRRTNLQRKGIHRNACSMIHRKVAKETHLSWIITI